MWLEGHIYTKVSLRENSTPSSFFSQPRPVSNRVAYPIVPAMISCCTHVACSGHAGLLVVLPQKCLEAELVEPTVWQQLAPSNCVIHTANKLLPSWKSPRIKSVKKIKTQCRSLCSKSPYVCFFPNAPHHEVNFSSNGQHS